MQRINSILRTLAAALEANRRLEEFELRRGPYRTSGEMAEIQAILDGNTNRH